MRKAVVNICALMSDAAVVATRTLMVWVPFEGFGKITRVGVALGPGVEVEVSEGVAVFVKMGVEVAVAEAMVMVAPL